MRRQRSPTFVAKDVCHALDIPHGTLNSWAFHGLFRDLDAATTKPGRPRKFTLADLFRLAIAKSLLDFGISGENARSWSTLCVSYMDQAKITEMWILIYRDFVQVHIVGDLEGLELPPPGALLRLTIYPLEIVKELQERLGVAPKRSVRKTR
jgi:hypothetical protein